MVTARPWNPAAELEARRQLHRVFGPRFVMQHDAEGRPVLLCRLGAIDAESLVAELRALPDGEGHDLDCTGAITRSLLPEDAPSQKRAEPKRRDRGSTPADALPRNVLRRDDGRYRAVATVRGHRFIGPVRNTAAEAADDLRRRPGERRARTPMTDDEVGACVERIARRGLPGCAALVVFVYGTGLRLCELARLRVGDIDVEGRRVICASGAVPLDDAAAHAAPKLVAGRDPAELVIGGPRQVDRVFAWLRELTGEPRLSPEQLRATAAARLIGLGHNWAAVHRFLRLRERRRRCDA